MPHSSANPLQLPPPGGPHPVGTRSWHLVDADRPDPWDTGRCRELMVQLWYPAGSAGDRARYLPVPVARLVMDSWAEDGVAAVRSVLVASSKRTWPVTPTRRPDRPSAA
ncbi:hypothetical protein SAMN05421805_1275 [Saccharopolyspora antimicrobica]|uniref:Uncharacterized protein n=1 Tax=Saccharopolyspora antimicrobica TaxID=455193 RepID=A0A1I5KGU7_9PSEU|nr:hypothetical protein [Saccharopolyspora antimicrobica]SFO84264.1 hypothetical protein SAMN05421805_1275 [Saccharopolyspora antimicrobica]